MNEYKKALTRLGEAGRIRLTDDTPVLDALARASGYSELVGRAAHLRFYAAWYAASRWASYSGDAPEDAVHP